MIGKRSPEKDQDYYNGLIEIIWSNVLDVKSELTGIKEKVNENRPFPEYPGHISSKIYQHRKTHLGNILKTTFPVKDLLKCSVTGTKHMIVCTIG